MGAIILESGRILSSHYRAVKHFCLFVFFGALTKQSEEIDFFAVEENTRTFHF
jgi:hypothetical protein